MRLLSVFLFVASLAVSARPAAQTITLSGKNMPLLEVFSAIKQQTGFFVLANRDLLTDAKPVTVSARNMPLASFLDSLLLDLPFSYSFEDKTIVIFRKSALVLSDLSFQAVSSDRLAVPQPITGRVVDSLGNGIEGASVRLTPGNKGTSTRSDGSFIIANVAPGTYTLKISLVGHLAVSRKITVAENAPLVLEGILLKVNPVEMEEVNVSYSTGYQDIPKERATGSFIYIDNKLLNRTVSTNILDRLSYVTSSLRKGLNGAELGDNKGTDISIRGLSTINASQRPLIVVDGFPYEEQGQVPGINILQNLNPNDVESITILRDAAAASIWGARSANGVIVIKTKQGRFNQQVSVQLNTNVSIVEKPDLFKEDIMSATDVIAYERDLFSKGQFNMYDDLYAPRNIFPVLSPVVEILLAQRRGELTVEQADARIAELEKHDVRNDILKYMLRPAVNQQYNLNVSGGGNKMSYYGSVGFDKNLSGDVGNSNNRLTLNFKNTFKPIRNLELSTYINYTQGKTNSSAEISANRYIPRGLVAMSPPYLMLADAEGHALAVPNPSLGLRTAYLDTLSTPGLLDWYYRPIDEMNNNNRVTKNIASRLGGSIQYNFITGLHLNLSGQYERSLMNMDNYRSLESFATRDLINKFMFINTSGQPEYPVPLGGILDYSTSEQTAYNLRAQLNFDRSFGDHGITALVGVERSQREVSFNSSRKYGYDPNTLLFAYNMDFKNRYPTRPRLSPGIIPIASDLGGSVNRFVSYFANAGYTFLNRYTFTASARTDGSNYFGVAANQRFSPLWSTGLAWNISQESFFRSSTLSNLKARITYGFNGNLDNSLPTLPTITYLPGTWSLNDFQIPAQINLGNPGLTWEKVGTFNIALDFGLFNNRINGSLEYYTKQTKNLIGRVRADRTVGVQEYIGNIADMNGRGIDLQINALLINKPVKVTSTLSISYNTDKITEYYMDPVGSATHYLFETAIVVGKPRYKVYSYKWAGLDPENGNPRGIVDGKVEPFTTVLGNDVDFKPNTKPEDLKYHGRATPSIFGNMLNTVSYKDLSFSFNITYGAGFYFRRTSINYNQIRANLSGHGDYARRWQKPGDELTTTVPSFGLDDRYTFYSNSEILVERGDYVYLQDVNLSYQLGIVKFPSIPIQSARLFINIQNLGMIWKANKYDLDPRNPGTQIPLQRQFALGLNVNF